MRVLITAGGTRAPIDEVRWVGNVSTGRFGAELARHCLDRGAEVIHLHARGSEMPFQRIIDFERDWQSQLDQAREAALAFEPVRLRYRSITFMEVDEYARLLESTLREESIDVAILSAAVSDFAPTPRRGKISSRTGEILIPMGPIPKLIAMVKDWAPSVYLVGFKLLVGVSAAELVMTAAEAGRASRADLTVANELRMLRQGRHTIHLVREGKPTETFEPEDEPAKQLVDRIFSWAAEKKVAQ